MKQFIEDLLHERRKTKTWLAGQLGIRKQSLNRKFENDSWNMKTFIKLLDIFQLTNDQIIEYIRKEQK